MITYYLRKLISLFVTDPMIRLFISLTLLVVLLWIVSFLPDSIKINAGIGVVIFVGLLNFKTVFGWIKDIFR